MLELYSWGDALMHTLDSVGDWLITTPGDFHIPLVVNDVIQGYVTIPNPFGSVATMLLGTGLIVLLGFKLAKFILDIAL